MSSIYMAMSRKSDASMDGSLDLDEIDMSEQEHGPQHCQNSLTSLRKPSLMPDDAIETNIRITTPRVGERKRHPASEEPDDQEITSALNTPASLACGRQNKKPMSSTPSCADMISPGWDQYCDKEQPSQADKEEAPNHSQLRRSSRCYERYASNKIDPPPSFPNSPTKTHRQTRYITEFLAQTEYSETSAESIDGSIYPGAVAVKAAPRAVAAERTIAPPLMSEAGPPPVYGIACDPSLLLVSAHIVADRERDSVMERRAGEDSDIEAPPQLRRTATRSTDEIRQEILSETVQATEIKTVKWWMYHRKTWLLISVATLSVVLVLVIQCKAAAAD
jgi:hypothetical protein